MRDRLIDLLRSIPNMEPQIRGRQQGKTAYIAAHIADHLLANGVIVPPCKVGDTVYSCIGRPYKVEKITIKRDQDHMTIVLDSALSGQLIVYENDFGQIVFLTREEAEKALAERSVE